MDPRGNVVFNPRGEIRRLRGTGARNTTPGGTRTEVRCLSATAPWARLYGSVPDFCQSITGATRSRSPYPHSSSAQTLSLSRFVARRRSPSCAPTPLRYPHRARLTVPERDRREARRKSPSDASLRRAELLERCFPVSRFRARWTLGTRLLLPCPRFPVTGGSRPVRTGGQARSVPSSYDDESFCRLATTETAVAALPSRPRQRPAASHEQRETNRAYLYTAKPSSRTTPCGENQRGARAAAHAAA